MLSGSRSLSKLWIAGAVLVAVLLLLTGCENPGPRLLVDGATFTLRGTWYADLDRAQEIGPGELGSDVWWEQVTTTERYWVPENGAKFTAFGTTRPDLADCQRAALTETKINGSAGPSNRIPSGTYLCGKTNEGHTVIVEVVNYGYNLDLKVWVYDR